MQHTYRYPFLAHTNTPTKSNPHYGLLGLRERYFGRERGHKHRQSISANNGNIHLQYLNVLNPKALHLTYTYLYTILVMAYMRLHAIH